MAICDVEVLFFHHLRNICFQPFLVHLLKDQDWLLIGEVYPQPTPLDPTTLRSPLKTMGPISSLPRTQLSLPWNNENRSCSGRSNDVWRRSGRRFEGSVLVELSGMSLFFCHPSGSKVSPLDVQHQQKMPYHIKLTPKIGKD